MIGCLGIAFGILVGYILALSDYRRDRKSMEASLAFWRERSFKLQQRLDCR